MVEDNSDEKKSGPGPVDVSGLQNLSLGPSWVSAKPAKARPSQSMPEERHRESGPARGGARDRRGGKVNRPPREGGGRGPDRGRSGPTPDADSRRVQERTPFRPIIEADFYPEDVPFKALAQAMKNSFRTFELFEIAKVILEKPERFVCVIRHPDQKAGEDALLWASVPDGLPFLSEREAIAHVMSHHLDQFFEIEEREVDPPAGNFQMVNRCGITGELLGPPNYHRFQTICQEHHAARLPQMSFERFQQRIESVREQEVIDQWLESMKKRTHYTLKEAAEGERSEFDSLEAARFHLLTKARDKLVRPAYSARFSGKAIPLLPAGDPIRLSLETLYAQQLRFPLDTANHLRGRLRRLNFAVYKKGSKGVSYVCAVKRRFRKADEIMADSLADLISFIEAHPNKNEKDLPREYLGISPPASAEASAEMPGEEREKVLSLRRDLKYLVSAGYVIEFSDGRLFVPPVREDGKEAPESDGPETEKPAPSASTPLSQDGSGQAKETSASGHDAAGTEAATAEVPTGPETESSTERLESASEASEERAELAAGEDSEKQPDEGDSSSENGSAEALHAQDGSGADEASVEVEELKSDTPGAP